MSDTCELSKAKQTIDLSGLIRAALGGDSSAADELRAVLRPGIRTLLVHRNASPLFADLILTQILDQVRVGRISCQSDLLRETRRAVIEMAGGSQSTKTGGISGDVVRLDLTSLDREMMRRYYVDGESAESICLRLSVPHDLFAAAKARLRAAIRTTAPGPAAVA